MVVVAQWVVLAAALALSQLWVPALILFWTIPFIAVFGDRSAFGSPIYSRVAFLWGAISVGCWAIGGLGLYALVS